MKTLIAAALMLAVFAGPALAEDAMAPMSTDAMAPMTSSDMANTMMSPNNMLAACLKNAGLLDGMAAQEAGKTTCNEAFSLAMGDTAMMSGGAMSTDGMAADPGAMAPAQ